jgi:glutamine synthetase
MMSEKIEYVELRFTDLLGRMKAMVVPCMPADNLEMLSSDPALKKGTSCDGSSITGLASVESSDLQLDPDTSTLIEIPLALQRTAAAMCFVRDKEAMGKSTDYYPLDSRGQLHKLCREALPGNLQLRIKVEPEFYNITPEGDYFDEAGYADTHPSNPAMDILLEIASAIREVGMQPRVIHHEHGKSQQEIEIDYDDARKMADNILIFKNLARAIAQSQGVDVTFMPKPFAGEAGNGLHCHLQLWDGKKNLFGDEKTNGLSETAKMFIAGLMEHAPAITAIANPTVNSYKRLVPHHEAPVYITWGEKNRTVLVRIPTFGTSEKAAVELRSGDSMANPYLLFCAIIAAGMDGINRKLVPPETCCEDIFMMTDKDRARRRIKTLPTTLEDALDCLEADSVIMDALGSKIAKAHIRLKREEWHEYVSEQVSGWEWEKYQDI